MISVQKKLEYLRQKWGFVKIERDLINVPVFDSKGILLRWEKRSAGAFCCRNYFVKDGEYADGDGNLFWGEVKELYGLSFEEAVDLAYKSERIGEQLDLFIREKF